MKLLIVDDNKKITDMFEEYLGFQGFKVTAINDGEYGLKIIQSGDFDKILLDIAMPKFGGLEILENLKKENFTDFEKIIILTASTLNKEISEKIKSLGVNKIISKPIDMPNLVKELEDKVI